jgi:hypothetical protein
MVEAYPLYWPVGWKRTPGPHRLPGRFRLTFAKARDELLDELDRMGAQQIVLSTNIPVRRDGLPYAGQREPEDSGAAVYFVRKGKPLCFACDRYEMAKDNINAIKHTIDALRGIERWGASDMLERAFRGFAALPDGSQQKHWREVLGFTAEQRVTADVLEVRFKDLARVWHPDVGGDGVRFGEISAARDRARLEIGCEVG